MFSLHTSFFTLVLPRPRGLRMAPLIQTRGMERQEDTGKVGYLVDIWTCEVTGGIRMWLCEISMGDTRTISNTIPYKEC